MVVFSLVIKKIVSYIGDNVKNMKKIKILNKIAAVLFAISFLILAGSFLAVSKAEATTAGPNTATGGVNKTNTGLAWSSPGNVVSSTLYSTITLSGSQVSDHLIGYGFGLNIPSGSIINGIVASAKAYASAGTPTLYFYLWKDYTTGGNVGGKQCVTSTSPAVCSVGSSADLWGTTWVPSEINANNLGIDVSLVYPNATVYVDQIQITVYYTLTTPTVTTTSVAGVDTQYATLNGTVNPNNYGNATGYFRWGTGNITCDDVAGTRYPSTGGTSIANGASPVAFSMPLPAGTLSPGTTYYYCAYASNANGVGKAATNASFTTPTATAGCAAPATGSFQITSSCYFPLAYDGVDAGSGAQNTAQFTIPAGLTFNIGNAIPNQVISFGVLSKPTGSTIVRFAGSQLRKGPIWAPDTDGDGYPDSANPTYSVNDVQPTGYVRRTVLASTLSVADCSTSNANIWQNIGNLVKDADNDGYKTSAAAASQCVGNTSSINGRTYYKDSAGAYTWMDAASALGSGATDCNDASGVPCAPTSVSASAASQTQLNVSWSAGVGPAATSYNLVWCSGASCTPSTTITGVTSVYAHTGRTCGTTYGYNVIAVNASGSSSASSTFYGTTSSCATVPSITAQGTGTITGTTAYLTSTGNSNGANTTLTYRYGTSNVACSSLPSTVGGSASYNSGAFSDTSAQITGLTGGTTYYYCVTANNSQGTTNGVSNNNTASTFSTPVVPAQIYASGNGWTTASMVVPSDNIPLLITEKGIYKCTTAECTAFTLVNSTYTSYYKKSDHQIAIGTDGLPIVVDVNKVYKCSNVSCTAGTESTMSVSVNTWASIAVPATGLPIIAYNAAGVPSVYKCANASCTSGTSAVIYPGGAPDPAGASITVTIAGDGLPVVAFNRDNYGVQVVHCGNAGCTSGNTTALLHSWYTGTAGQAFQTLISIDKGTDGYPILSYINEYSSCSNGSCVPYVYKCSNYSCSAGTESSLGGTYMLHPSIRVPSDGLPIVGINGWNANTQIAKVIKCGNNACSSGNTTTAYLTKAQCGPVQSWGSAIGFNSSNIPYYSFTGSCNAPWSGGWMVKCRNTTCN